MHWAGGYVDDMNTAIYFDNARYYDPITGRFINQDPIGFGGGTANVYEYGKNDPTNETDPSGLEPWRTLFGGASSTNSQVADLASPSASQASTSASDTFTQFVTELQGQASTPDPSPLFISSSSDLETEMEADSHSVPLSILYQNDPPLEYSNMAGMDGATPELTAAELWQIDPVNQGISENYNRAFANGTAYTTTDSAGNAMTMIPGFAGYDPYLAPVSYGVQGAAIADLFLGSGGASSLGWAPAAYNLPQFQQLELDTQVLSVELAASLTFSVGSFISGVAQGGAAASVESVAADFAEFNEIPGGMSSPVTRPIVPPESGSGINLVYRNISQAQFEDFSNVMDASYATRSPATAEIFNSGADAASGWTAPDGWRLPANDGSWTGTPGNSSWMSTLDSVTDITNGDPISFNNGYIDLSPYAIEEYEFNNLTGTRSDFGPADAQFAKDYGFQNAGAAKF